MIAEILSVVWLKYFGMYKVEYHESLRQQMLVDKGMETGGYQKVYGESVLMSETPVETCVWPHVCKN